MGGPVGSFTVALGGPRPVAIVSPGTQRAEKGVFVGLNARASSDPSSSSLTYAWSFVSKPATSRLENSDFILLDPDGSLVAFLPDVTGQYEVQLVVNNGSLDSLPSLATVDMNLTTLPYGEGDIPDASFIWKTISSFWSLVDGKEALTTVFSAAIQMIASQLLRLYQSDFCKALLEIPNALQRRWLEYPTRLTLNPTQNVVYLGDQMEGYQASTGVMGFQGLCTITSATELLLSVGLVTPAAIGHTLVIEDNINGNAGRYTILSMNATRTGYRVSGAFSALGVERFYIESWATDKANVIYVPLSEADLSSIVFPAGRLIWLEGRCYQILRTFQDHTNFSVPVTGVIVNNSSLSPQAFQLRWRIPCMLRSSNMDFGLLGVSEGDLLEFEVQAYDNGAPVATASYWCQVVGTQGTKLGFVPSATLSASPTDAEISALARALGIPTDTVDGVSPKDVFLRNLQEPGFGSRYHHVALADTTDITVSGVPFRILARSMRLLRKVFVDSTLLSVPLLQQKILSPDKQYQENKDYYVDGPDTIQGEDGTIEGNTGKFSSPSGLFLQREVLPGDTLRLYDGAERGEFKVVRVLSDTLLLVWPNFTQWDSNIKFQILRQNRNTYLRFSSGLFTPQALPPDRLWADVSYFDPSTVVEETFGNRVDFSIREYTPSSFGGTYRDIVTTLLYAAMTGPTPENLRRCTQGVLGLPMASQRGRVLEIEEGYRAHHRTGEPFLGRVVLQDMDNHVKWETARDFPDMYMGTRGRVYYYPAIVTGQEDYTGLATNPETGERYKVGDVVERFALLSRGVQYADYISDPNFWRVLRAASGLSAWEVQKFHHFAVRVLGSLLTSSEQMAVVQEVLDRARPGYTDYDLAVVSSLSDSVEITDELLIGLTYLFTDNPCWGLETSYSYGLPNGHGELVFIYGKGALSTRITKHGKDLSVSAGLATTGEDLAYVKPGDHLVVFSSAYAGRYHIDSVVGNSLAVSQLSGAWPETCPDPSVWDPAQGLTFTIQRELRNPISQTTELVTLKSTQLIGGDWTTTVQLTEDTPRLDGVAAGDYLAITWGGGATQGPFDIYEYDTTNNTITFFGRSSSASIIGLTFGRRLFDETVELPINGAVGNVLFLDPGTELALGGVRRKERIDILDPGGAILSSHLIVDLKEFGTPYLFLVPPPPVGLPVGAVARVTRPYPGIAYSALITDCPRDELMIDRVPDVDTVTGNVGGFFTSAGEDFEALGVLPGDEILISPNDVYYVYQVSGAQADVTRTPPGAAGLSYVLRRRD